MKKIKSKLKKLINYNLSKFGLAIIKKKPNIVEINKEEENLINLSKKFSMTTEIRMWALLNSLKKVNADNVEGDIVECGIWKGGNIILVKNFLEINNMNRNIFCYDTFEGMHETNEFDKEISTNLDASEIIKGDNYFVCKSTLEETKKNIESNVKNLNHVNFIKGKVEETLLKKENLPEKISICRLDTDYYSSTKTELDILYPRISKGGILIIDDYGHWSGSKKAVDEFFNKDFVMMHYVDYACRLIIKN